MIFFYLLSKTFTSQYAEFEIPNNWDCLLQEADWVCSEPSKEYEALIVLTSKIRDESDDTSYYQAYLKKPKPGLSESNVRSVKTTLIQNHPWVEALHLDSEIKGYYTRYLVTTKEDLAIGLTFTMRKDLFEKYQSTYNLMVQSLKVFKKDVSTAKMILTSPSYEPQEPLSSDDAFKLEVVKKTDLVKQGSSSFFLLLLLVGGFLGYRIYKKRQGL